MTDETNAPSPGPGPAKLADLMDKAFQILAARYEFEQQAGGKTPDLDAVLKGLKPGNNPEIMSLCVRGWDEVTQLAEHEYLGTKRKLALERLIVHRFGHLVAPTGEAAVQGRTLSRRVVEAFLTTLHNMVGPDVFQEYTTRCQTLVEEKRAALGEDFAWEAVYDDPAGIILVTDILVYIARYFEDMEKRRTWMIDVFSHVLPPPSIEAERHWTFGPLEFHMLIEALYADLEQAVKDPERSIPLNRRYGAHNLMLVRAMMEALKIDRRAVNATIQSKYKS